MLSLDELKGPRWERALQLLLSGEAAVALGDLVLSVDPPTAGVPGRVHVEFDCPFDPSQVGRAPHEHMQAVAQRDLAGARDVIARACEGDDRFASLIRDSGLVFEYVHRLGTGALLVAAAGASGDLSWR